MPSVMLKANRLQRKQNQPNVPWRRAGAGRVWQGSLPSELPECSSSPSSQAVLDKDGEDPSGQAGPCICPLSPTGASFGPPPGSLENQALSL